MSSRHLPHYPTRPGWSSLCLSLVFTVKVGRRQTHSVATFPSCLPMPYQVMTGKVQSTININMNKKMNLKMTGY